MVEGVGVDRHRSVVSLGNLRKDMGLIELMQCSEMEDWLERLG